MKTIKILAILVLLPPLFSCSFASSTVEDVSNVQQPSAEERTDIPGAEQIFTSTTPATQTSAVTQVGTNTPSPSATSTKSANNSCVVLVNTNFSGTGQLIATNLKGRSENDPYYVTLSMDTSIKAESDVPNFRFKASPDRDMLLYYSFNKSAYELIDGKREITLNISQNEYVDWVDQETLVVRSLNTSGMISQLYFLRPWEEEREDFSGALPDFYGADQGLIQSWGGIPLFDLSGEFILFPGTNGIEIATFPELSVLETIVSSPYEYVPVWNPLGGSFVVPGQVDYSNELLFFDTQDNSIKPLTHFSDTYSYFKIGKISWSPNGRWLAFWTQFGANSDLENPSKTLVLINLETETLFTTCLTSNQFVGSGILEGMIWSPDSTQLVLNTYSAPNQPSSLILVDIEKMSSRVLDENKNISPVAWINFEITEIK